MKNYLNLSVPAKTRLAILKKLNPIDWKKARMATFLNHAQYCGDLSHGFNVRGSKKTPILYSFYSDNFRNETFCDMVENSGINHTGWFNDSYCDVKTRGFICNLPHGKFLSGYELSGSGERVYFLDIETDQIDAARRANDLAEECAESEREYSQNYHAARELDEKNESLFVRLRECLALRNNPCFTALRSEALDIVASIKANRETLKNDYAGVL